MKELLTARPVTRISIADKPLLIGGQITEIDQEEFEKRFGVKAGEGIYVDESFPHAAIEQAKENITSIFGREYFTKQIPAVINDPFAHVAIAFINDKVGYGLFAKHEIKKGTLICIYSGEIGSSLDRKSLKGLEFGYYNTNFCYKQSLFRGVASFIQHMPVEPKFPDVKKLSSVLSMIGQQVSEEELMLDTELYCLKFSSADVRANLATANIDQEYLIYKGVPVIAMVANRDIHAGSELGTKYGYQYFNFHPELFDLKGGIIQRNLYQRTYGRLFFKDFTYSGNYASIIHEIETKATLRLNTSKGLREVPAEQVRQSLIDACAIPSESPISTVLRQWKAVDIHQALRRAAQEGSEKDLQMILSTSKDININSRDTNLAKGYTALHLAVMKNSETNVLCLLKHGASAEVQDVKGKTPLDYANTESMHNLLLGIEAEKMKVKYFQN